MTQDDIRRKTTQELNDLIESDIMSEDGLDFETVDQILEELERRAKEQGDWVDLKAAKQKFDSMYRQMERELYPEVKPTEEKPMSGKKKKLIGRTFLVAALLAALIAIPVAGQRSSLPAGLTWHTVDDSEQIKGEVMDVLVTKDGEISVIYRVSGKGEVRALGAEEISIWRQVGEDWIEAVRYDETNPALSKTEKSTYAGEVVYQGRPGGVYRVEMTVFVENQAGRDTRTATIPIEIES
mgnify:FL=1